MQNNKKPDVVTLCSEPLGIHTNALLKIAVLGSTIKPFDKLDQLSMLNGLWNTGNTMGIYIEFIARHEWRDCI